MFKPIPLLLVAMLWLAPSPAMTSHGLYESFEWEKFMEVGDEAVLLLDFELAIEKYTAALALGEILLPISDRFLAGSLSALADVYRA